MSKVQKRMVFRLTITEVGQYIPQAKGHQVDYRRIIDRAQKKASAGTEGSKD